jgi:hypothetical protein
MPQSVYHSFVFKKNKRAFFIHLWLLHSTPTIVVATVIVRTRCSTKWPCHISLISRCFGASPFNHQSFGWILRGQMAKCTRFSIKILSSVCTSTIKPWKVSYYLFYFLGCYQLDQRTEYSFNKESICKKTELINYSVTFVRKRN